MGHEKTAKYLYFQTTFIQWLASPHNHLVLQEMPSLFLERIEQKLDHKKVEHDPEVHDRHLYDKQ